MTKARQRLLENVESLPSQASKRELEGLAKTILVLGFLVHLLTSNEFQNQLFLALKPRLDWFFPEECVADLESLHLRIQAKYQNHWFSKLIMLRAIAESFWAFYIQIKIENLSYSRKAHTRRLEY
jgi:hypothetical protein